MTTAQSNVKRPTLIQSPNNERKLIMYRDKKQNNGIIDFTTVDRDGRIVKMTPKLFVETACAIAHTDKYGLSKIIAASSSQYRKKHLELLDEKRLPSIKEFFSFCRLLNTFKADFVRMFELIVNKQYIPATSEPATAKSALDVYRTLKGIDNSAKETEVNTLNLQFTWPKKEWGVDMKDIGEGVCELFRGEDFENDALFCNYTDANGNPIDSTTIGVDAGKFKSADSFGKVIDGLRRLLRIVYIDSPLLDYPVGALDEPIYTLMDKEVYDRLYEIALNGVSEGVDIAPLQKYLYQKGVINLPNINDKVLEQKEEDEYITFKFKVHKDTLEKFKNTNGKTEVIVDSTSYSDYGYNRVVARIRDILRDDYKKRHGNDAYPESLITSIWEMMYEEKERAAFWQLYNLVKDEHADYNGKLYKNLEDYVIRKGLAVCKPTGFNLENIKKENINTTIKAIAKMVADYIGFDVKDVVFTLFHDGDMLTSTGETDRLDTIARHSQAWYDEVTRKQNVAAETSKISVPQQNTRPTVVIKATNVGASVISSIAEAYNGNVDIRVETEQVGKITIDQQ